MQATLAPREDHRFGFAANDMTNPYFASIRLVQALQTPIECFDRLLQFTPRLFRLTEPKARHRGDELRRGLKSLRCVARKVTSKREQDAWSSFRTTIAGAS